MHEFKKDEDGSIILTKRNDIGLYIDSMWSIAKQPCEAVTMQNPVRFILPISEGTHYILKNNFIHVQAWKVVMINQYLEGEFRRRIRDFFSIGYEKGFRQKNIIESFLIQYGMKNNAINFDMIKKYDYRCRESMKKAISKEIQDAVF